MCHFDTRTARCNGFAAFRLRPHVLFAFCWCVHHRGSCVLPVVTNVFLGACVHTHMDVCACMVCAAPCPLQAGMKALDGDPEELLRMQAAQVKKSAERNRAELERLWDVCTCVLGGVGGALQDGGLGVCECEAPCLCGPCLAAFGDTTSLVVFLILVPCWCVWWLLVDRDHNGVLSRLENRALIKEYD